MYKKIFVPQEVYLNDVKKEYIHLVEEWFYQNIDFFPAQVREDLDFAHYGLRMGHAFMNNIKKQVPTDSNLNVVSLGDEKFQWKFDSSLISEDEESVFICAGAGTNISFEIALAEKYPNVPILLLDPSPQAIRYVSSLSLPKNITFISKGLSNKSGILNFLKPNVDNIGSLSSKSLVRGTEYLSLEVSSIADLIEEYQINNIDILKFDIEGSEHDVVRSLSELKFFPRQIAFEFDFPVPIWTVQETIKYAISLGYKVVDIWATNILMIFE